MLILSRKLSEQIVIGDGIVVTVVAIRGGNVRLGIDAPENISVHRKEVYEALRRQSRQQDRGPAKHEGDRSGSSSRPAPIRPPSVPVP